MKKAILFDLDGTVLASKEGVFNSVSHALTKLSLPMPSEAELMAFLGPPIQEGFARVCRVPHDLVDEAIRCYREYYNGGGKFEAEIYKGIADLLNVLRNNGKRCYITTSKPQVFAREILEHFDMADAFDGIYGSELDGTRGEKADVLRYCLAQQGLSAQDAVLVGDRYFDVNGAKEVGMDCIGILYGYGEEEELRAAGATYIAADTTALQKLLLTL